MRGGNARFMTMGELEALADGFPEVEQCCGHHPIRSVQQAASQAPVFQVSCLYCGRVVRKRDAGEAASFWNQWKGVEA
jgi:hypothetical protein